MGNNVCQSSGHSLWKAAMQVWYFRRSDMPPLESCKNSNTCSIKSGSKQLPSFIPISGSAPVTWLKTSTYIAI